jgi:hypothetical protein
MHTLYTQSDAPSLNTFRHNLVSSNIMVLSSMIDVIVSFLGDTEHAEDDLDLLKKCISEGGAFCLSGGVSFAS